MAGKKACKSHLQRTLGPDVEPDVPLVVYISRLTDQKMADVVADVIPELLKRRIQFASLGRGDHEIEARLARAVRNYPGRASVQIGYEEDLAHQFCAGGDILLHPARFEPCGLTLALCPPMWRGPCCPSCGRSRGYHRRRERGCCRARQRQWVLVWGTHAAQLARVPGSHARAVPGANHGAKDAEGRDEPIFRWGAPALQYVKLYQRLAPAAKIGVGIPLSRSRRPQGLGKGALANAAKL